MSIYDIPAVREQIGGNAYVGRGIAVGTTADGTQAVTAYFIMGRSENSRNRVFEERDGAVYTAPFDASKVEDPSLIIYRALCRVGNRLVVTNGDQTDTVATALSLGRSFRQALDTREFEPDKPNYTPRISAQLTFDKGSFTYEMSILKSVDAAGSACCRYLFAYPAVSGLGHLIHTYAGDGNPLPSFRGEPERIAIPDSIDAFTAELWDSLDADNRVSLYVRYTDLTTGREENRLVNKNA